MGERRTRSDAAYYRTPPAEKVLALWEAGGRSAVIARYGHLGLGKVAKLAAAARARRDDERTSA